jgi:hypothetical protein
MILDLKIKGLYLFIWNMLIVTPKYYVFFLTLLPKKFFKHKFPKINVKQSFGGEIFKKFVEKTLKCN